jgi:glutamyl/glutaminyl-tRNA synthetase
VFELYYLFAKKNGGTFFLRIEDTDQNRFVLVLKVISEALEWLESPDETIGKMNNLDLTVKVKERYLCSLRQRTNRQRLGLLRI